MDRDTNAALNMLYVFAWELNTGERPLLFTRAHQQMLRSNSLAQAKNVSVPVMENGHAGVIIMPHTTDDSLFGYKPE